PASAFPRAGGGNRSLGRTHRSCQTFSHSQVVMGPRTRPAPHKATTKTPAGHGLHTVPMTERDLLAAAARTAGLRLTTADLEALGPAWKRYQALVEELRSALAPGPSND